MLKLESDNRAKRLLREFLGIGTRYSDRLNLFIRGKGTVSREGWSVRSSASLLADISVKYVHFYILLRNDTGINCSTKKLNFLNFAQLIIFRAPL